MFSIGKRNKKGIAAFFLIVVTVQNFYPAAAYALTSGPVQPEMQQFQAVGSGNMVDLFSGDFKYDIPLMDVGGYPVNISYHGGNNPEDEASWVGMGWTLSPGAVNRNMRGIPDDFTGKATIAGDQPDRIRTFQNKKPFYKIGGQFTLKPTIFAKEKGSVSLHVDVYKDNYYGIGGSVGASIDYNIAKAGSTTLNAGLSLNSDSRSGVTVEPSLGLSMAYEGQDDGNGLSLSGSLKYNTRAGLEEAGLSASFDSRHSLWDTRMIEEQGNHFVETSRSSLGVGIGSYTVDFSHGYTPSLGASTRNTNSSFSLDLGPAFFGGYLGIGGTGYVTTQTNLESILNLPAFGYLNYADGATNTNALLDFNREKDGTFLTTAPSIPIPVATQDYFTATSQFGTSQYRPFYNGEYTVFDRTYTDISSTLGAGLTAGFGNIFQAGARVSKNTVNSVTHRWNTNYAMAADAAPGSTVQTYEKSYFKKTGELSRTDANYLTTLNNDVTQKVRLSAFSSTAQADAIVVTASGEKGVGAMHRTVRDKRTSSFSYLNYDEARKYGLDTKINGQYDFVGNSGDATIDFVNDGALLNERVHKLHHISEITLTEADGKRLVYGVPVYNREQQEISFNSKYQSDLSSFGAVRKTGQVAYTQDERSLKNGNGRSNYFSDKVIPPYATSYLLSGILSPDYVDLTGNGISDDDLGTAVKFRYDRSSYNYHWRAPYEEGVANFNEGFLSDNKDDKASIIYGIKELWYLDTIESKTMVAIFYKSGRADGWGVKGIDGGRSSDPGDQQMKLDSIRLFTKAEIAKNGNLAVPVKVAHFEYDYSLQPGVPNSVQDIVADLRDPLAPYGPYSAAHPYDPDGHLIPGNPNKGKLTLRKVYFTFGANVRGRSNPYIFSYNTAPVNDQALQNTAVKPTDIAELNDAYTQRQTDRWGTYKQSYYNKLVQQGSSIVSELNNSEFPYTLQPSADELFDTRLLEDRFAAKWQLSSITVPTGGQIAVEYESDDYSFVQDRKAMEECQLTGTEGAHTSDNLIAYKNSYSGENLNMLYVKVPVAIADQQKFINSYLTGPDGKPWGSLAYKVFTDLDNRADYEYVYGYAEVGDLSKLDLTRMSSERIAGIPVKPVADVNPIAKAAWQMLQADLPQHAYENYDNSDASGFGGDVKAAVLSILQAFVNLRELGQSFDGMARGKGYAHRFVPEKSMVRLNCPIGSPIGKFRNTYGKLGGGSRVKRVEIYDNWTDVRAGANAKPLYNGILYEYTTKDDNNLPVSSGVASYEPGNGNEENPFHEPVMYTEKTQWSQDRYHFVDMPYAESYFPAPEVGYSEVKATPYGADKPYWDATRQHSENSGYTISAFYTAKDFPTVVDYMPLDQRTAEDDLTLLLFATKAVKRVSTSQGFKIVVNDMHGKPRATSVYDKGGNLISSTEYFYNVKDNNALKKQLDNNVLTMEPDESNGVMGIGQHLVGTDEELVTDVRESTTNSGGTSIGAYSGLIEAIWPIPYTGINYNATSSVKSYNSISTIKVIHQFGILKSIRTTDKGSTLMADNLLWDGNTGQVLLSRTQNEFDDYTYSLGYPAYLAYDGMGAAYKNIGTIFQDLTYSGNGSINATYNNYLSPGDELVNLDMPATSPMKGWVIPDHNAPGNFKIIDQSGNFITTNGNYKLIRSGRRNFLSASVGTLVTMNNPLVVDASGNYTLQGGVDRRVLAAKAETYKDEWDMPVAKFLTTTPSSVTETCTPSMSSFKQRGSAFQLFLQTLFLNGVKPSISRRNLFAVQSDGVTLADLVAEGIGTGLFDSDMYGNLLTACNIGSCHTDLSQIYYYIEQTHVVNGFYYLEQGDKAYIGTATQQLAEVDFSTVSAGATTLLSDPGARSPTTAGCYAQAFGCDASGIGTAEVDFSYRTACAEGVPTDLVVIWKGMPYSYPVTPTTVCTDPVNQVLNPYYQDVKGVWRMEYDHVYQVNRIQTPGNPSQNGGTNIRTSGYYSNFAPFWTINGTSLTPMPEVDHPKHILQDPAWEWTSKLIHFDQKGNSVETVDPLQRYNAALYGYLQTVPIAVATNARQNEIAFDGFEDYYFKLRQFNPIGQCPTGRHLDMKFPAYDGTSGLLINDGGSQIVSGIAHSGNYSMKLSGVTINQAGGNDKPFDDALGFNGIGQYILTSNEQAAGFAPIPGKKYLLSMWVRDQDFSNTLLTDVKNTISGLTLTLNGTSYNSGTNDISNWPLQVVEGWKKLEIVFTATSTFSLSLSASGEIYIDDLRIQPFDSQMKTFVYDDHTMRLTGQLDENNYGIFYEYDEEGTPIRVKKETERGIMTVKENRQSYIKQ